MWDYEKSTRVRVFNIYLCVFNQVKVILQRNSIWVISKISRLDVTKASIKNPLRGTLDLSNVWGLLGETLETTNYWSTSRNIDIMYKSDNDDIVGDTVNVK